jgi:hypothetical protein
MVKLVMTRSKSRRISVAAFAGVPQAFGTGAQDYSAISWYLSEHAIDI